MVGAIGWVGSMTFVGYFLGRSVPQIERYVHWIIGGVIFLSLLPLLREWRLSRRRADAARCP